MPNQNNIVQLEPASTTAPLQNVAICARALERAIQRPLHLPGLVSLYGPSGYGKSVAAAYAANKHKGYYVEAKSTWTKKAALAAILTEMGVLAAKTVYEMADQVAEQLVLSGRPLIIDEMDYLVQRNCVELVRDIYESSNAPILLIGEENLEVHLRKWERFHNRILEWVPAQPANADDAKHLARLYSRDVEIDETLLQEIAQIARGGIRRIAVNIERVRQFGLSQGLSRVTRIDWGSRDLYIGEAPRRRV